MEKIRVVLPKKYDLIVGDVFQLFFRGVVEAPNPYCYDILAVCEKGRNYPRYFEYLPEEEGEYKLTIYVYDADKNVLGKGETILCVNKLEAPKKQKNILCMGARVMARGLAMDLVEIFLNTEFEGGRHATRVNMFEENID